MHRRKILVPGSEAHSQDPWLIFGGYRSSNVFHGVGIAARRGDARRVMIHGYDAKGGEPVEKFKRLTRFFSATDRLDGAVAFPRFVDAWSNEAMRFVANEFVPHTPLAFELMLGGALSLAHVLRIGLDLAESFARAHSLVDDHGAPTPLVHGFIHRDDVGLRVDGRPVVFGLGSARGINHDDVQPPRLRWNDGRSPSASTPADDTYSIGAIMTLALAGRVPIADGRAPLGTLPAAFMASSLGALIASCLGTASARPTARHLADALRAHLTSQPASFDDAASEAARSFDFQALFDAHCVTPSHFAVEANRRATWHAVRDAALAVLGSAGPVPRATRMMVGALMPAEEFEELLMNRSTRELHGRLLALAPVVEHELRNALVHLMNDPSSDVRVAARYALDRQRRVAWVRMQAQHLLLCPHDAHASVDTRGDYDGRLHCPDCNDVICAASDTEHVFDQKAVAFARPGGRGHIGPDPRGPIYLVDRGALLEQRSVAVAPDQAVVRCECPEGEWQIAVGQSFVVGGREVHGISVANAPNRFRIGIAFTLIEPDCIEVRAVRMPIDDVGSALLYLRATSRSWLTVGAVRVAWTEAGVLRVEPSAPGSATFENIAVTQALREERARQNAATIVID